MDITTTIPVTEARKNIFKILDELASGGPHYTLTDKGRAKAVLLSAEEYDSWIETMAVLKDIPNLWKHIRQAEKKYEKGDFITLDELLKKEGFVINNKYDLSDRNSAPSTKRSRKTAKKSQSESHQRVY